MGKKTATMTVKKAVQKTVKKSIRIQSQQAKQYPTIEDALRLVGSGLFISALFLFPGAGLGIKAILDECDRRQQQREKAAFAKFNLSRLRYALHRLHRQKAVQVVDTSHGRVVQLTEKGRMRMLQYRLDEMVVRTPPVWDRKWRIILYDIGNVKKRQQMLFRSMLKRLKMVPIQRSVYLTPYSCEDEITFLREYFDIADGVLYIVTNTLENEEEYRTYFGLK